MNTYTEGTKLKENEFLLKIRGYDEERHPTGFITKLNKDGSIPVAFRDWYAGSTPNPEYIDWKTTPNIPRSFPKTMETTVHIEEFSTGWRIYGSRFGKSQNWATMVHPKGFILEIYMTNLISLLKISNMQDGELMGEFKWSKNQLVKKN